MVLPILVSQILVTTIADVRDFRERIAGFSLSYTAAAIASTGRILGVYYPFHRKRRSSAEIAEIKGAANRLAEALPHELTKKN